jgi:hypothetical protein
MTVGRNSAAYCAVSQHTRTATAGPRRPDLGGRTSAAQYARKALLRPTSLGPARIPGTLGGKDCARRSCRFDRLRPTIVHPNRNSGTAAAAMSTAASRVRVNGSFSQSTAIKIANTALVSRSAAPAAIGAWV